MLHLAALSLTAFLSTALHAPPVRAEITSPKLTQIERIQTDERPYGNPFLIREQGRAPLLVMITESQNDRALLHLTAYGPNGVKLGRMSISKPQGPRQWVEIKDVARNARGEIVVVTHDYPSAANVHPPLARLMVHNLAKRKSVELTQSALYPEVLSRVDFQGRALRAVAEHLERTADDTQPMRVRIMDEDSGEVLQEKTFGFAGSGRLGVSHDGRLKLLLSGYELFGVLDVESGYFGQILPRRRQPSDYPMDITLTSGTFLKIQHDGKLHLLKHQDLLNGQFEPVQSFVADTEFVGQPVPRFAVSREKDGILITDLSNGEVLGPKIPKPSFSEPRNSRMNPSVEDVLVTANRTVAVVFEALQPHSYLPGSVLTYFDVKTGKVLRTRSQEHVQVIPRLIEVSPGRIVSVEHIGRILGSAETRVVDLQTGEDLSLSPGVSLLGSPFRTAQGGLLGLRAQDDNLLCVFNLLAPSKENCIKDPLILGLTRHGYSPFEVGTGKLTLPLIDRSAQQSFPVLGFAEFQVD